MATAPAFSRKQQQSYQSSNIIKYHQQALFGVSKKNSMWIHVVGSGVKPGLIHRKSLMVHLHPRHRDAIAGADEKPVILQPKVGTAWGDAMSFWKDKVTWWLSLAILDPIKSINPPNKNDQMGRSSLFEA